MSAGNVCVAGNVIIADEHWKTDSVWRSLIKGLGMVHFTMIVGMEVGAWYFAICVNNETVQEPYGCRIFKLFEYVERADRQIYLYL